MSKPIPDTKDPLDSLLLHAVAKALHVGPMISRGGLPNWRLQRVANHIEANISGRLSNQELAAVAQVSTSHFNRAFRQTVGVTPHGYVTRRRVATAQMLISAATYPLAQVAIMCGTADQAHLNRIFTRHCGVTPGAWRSQRLTANNSA